MGRQHVRIGRLDELIHLGRSLFEHQWPEIGDSGDQLGPFGVEGRLEPDLFANCGRADVSREDFTEACRENAAVVSLRISSSIVSKSFSNSASSS